MVARVCDPRYRLVSVVAPPGYGKTRLVAQAVHTAGRPVAWVTAGPECGDAIVLARYLAIALEPWCPIDPELRRELVSAHARQRVVVAGLDEAVREGPDDLTIVIDDLQELTRLGHELLRSIVANVRASGHVVLVGTRAAPFLSRERASGGVCEIGTGDLAFDDEEAAALLRGAGVPDVDTIDVAALRDRTEGWAAAIYLSALALREGGGSLADADEPLGSGARFISDFLRDAVLARLPPDQVDFLTRTSVLQELSGPLCDAVLESHDAAARLARLEAENLFVVPLDERGERYRYHGLFRDRLATELSRRSPGLVPGLHARASEWYEANGSPEGAFRHAAAGSDVGRCASLLARHGQRLYVTGRETLLAEWLDWFGSHASLEDHPEVATRATWIMIMTGRHVGLERWATGAAKGAAAHPMERHEEGIRLLAEAAMFRHGLDAMVRDAEHGRSLLPDESTWWPAAWILAGMCSLMRGDVDGAAAGFRTAVERAEGLRSYAGLAIAVAELGFCDLRRGDLEGAATHAAHVRDVIETGELHGYPLGALGLGLAARVALLQGDPERAERFLREADALRKRLTVAFPVIALQARLELARCAIGLGDLRSARTYLDEADGLVHDRPDMGTLVDDLQAIEADLDTRQASGPIVRSLTPAEMRLLPLLATHLSFRGIGEQLSISHHTVKTQAISIYRKLGVTSRSVAIEEARRLGLLGP